MTQPKDTVDPRWRLTPAKVAAAVILLIAIVVPLLVGTYARIEPRLFGFPFFYWYQLLWVVLAAGLSGVAYWLLKRERDAYDRGQRGSADRPRE
jgi:high-affinity Fe2+/Pb2+ permease